MGNVAATFKLSDDAETLKVIELIAAADEDRIKAYCKRIEADTEAVLKRTAADQEAWEQCLKAEREAWEQRMKAERERDDMLFVGFMAALGVVCLLGNRVAASGRRRGRAPA